MQLLLPPKTSQESGSILLYVLNMLIMYNLMFNVCMGGVVREVNVWVLGKSLELLSTKGGRFEINQLLFADDTALVAD